MSVKLNYYMILEDANTQGTIEVKYWDAAVIYLLLLAVYNSEKETLEDRGVARDELSLYAAVDLKISTREDQHACVTTSLKKPLANHEKVAEIWNAPPDMAFIHLVVVIMPLVPLPAFPFDASISPRENTVAGIWEKMMRYSFILVRGTVGTGKTTLAGLIQKHAQKVLPSVTLISLINWPKNPQRRSEVRARLNRRLGLPTIFILTSAELSYDDIDLWLDFLKNIHDHQPKNFYAIVFESYGYTFSSLKIPMDVETRRQITLSPIDHKDGCPAVGLLLTREEFDDMIRRRYEEKGGHIFEDSFLARIFDFTGGHGGALHHVLWFIEAGGTYRSTEHSSGGRFTLDAFQQEYAPDDFVRLLRVEGSVDQIGLPNNRDFDEPAVSNALSLVAVRTIVTDESVPESVQDSLRQCAHRGWLHSDPVGKERVGYVFASPLHQWFVQWKLFSQIAPENALGATLLEFVLGVVRLFNPRRLPEHVRRNGPGFLPRPPETQFQDEFYRCSHIYSSGSIVTFPELGSTGHADFYVPSKKWGIEVFRHGDQLGERIGRFSQHGVYHPTYDLDDFIILHFHTTELEDKSTSMDLSAYPSCDPGLSNVYHVVFQEGYRRVVVMDEKKQTVENGEFMLIDR